MRVAPILTRLTAAGNFTVGLVYCKIDVSVSYFALVFVRNGSPGKENCIFTGFQQFGVDIQTMGAAADVFAGRTVIDSFAVDSDNELAPGVIDFIDLQDSLLR